MEALAGSPGEADFLDSNVEEVAARVYTCVEASLFLIYLLLDQLVGLLGGLELDEEILREGKFEVDAGMLLVVEESLDRD